MKMQLMFRVIVLFHFICSGNGSSLKRILVDDNFYTLVNKLNGLEQELAALKAIVAHNDTLQALQKDVAALKAQHVSKTDAVAFMAELTSHVRGTNHHIYFDDVKINIGNAYNPNHGMFVAPVNGLYQFSVTACSQSGHYIVLELTVNQSTFGKVITGDDWVINCHSKSFVIKLSAGDDVYVQHKTVGEYLYANAGYSLPSFSGFLIKSM